MTSCIPKYTMYCGWPLEKTEKKCSYEHCVNAGVERIELPSAVLETDVLPLYDTPNTRKMTRTGFEPVNAAVKGRCVKPLHQRAMLGAHE